MITRRTSMLACGSLLVAPLWAPSRMLAADTKPVEGSKLNWSGEIPAGWFGGTPGQLARQAAQLEEDHKKGRSNDADFQRLRRSLGVVIEGAKDLDNYYVNFRDMSRTNRTTSIRIDYGQIDAKDFRDKSERSKWWDALMEATNSKLKAAGLSVTRESDEVSTTGGSPSYSMRYRVNLPKLSPSYSIWHGVSRGGNNWHIFEFTADSLVFKELNAEFQSLLKSVKYQ